MDALEALDDLNNCSQRYANFNDLKLGDYAVRKFSVAPTKQGDRIRVDLDEYFVFLPKRYLDKIGEKKCAELNKFNFIMTFGGKEYTNKDRLILSFKLAPKVAEDSLPILDQQFLF